MLLSSFNKLWTKTCSTTYTNARIKPETEHHIPSCCSPKYRTIGLGSKLIKDTLSLAGTEYVEMSAVMTKYNPFAEKAGMTKIDEQCPPKEASNILKTLGKFGFDKRLLGSETYVRRRLETLSDAEILEIKEVFTRQRRMRFMKSFSYHLPFGSKGAYDKEIARASMDTLARLARTCGFLEQLKVHLI